MRVTNSMIVENTKSNINSNKVNVDKYNTQMTTQKKINKASDDPVIAIRSLRMQTTLSHLDQYLENNITDTNAWLETTDTALSNMVTILESVRTQCVAGSTDTVKEEDRDTILEQLEQMVDQVYSEGNADYAGRSIFTGYRTTSMLTFQEDDSVTKYSIDQTFDYNDLTSQRYYYGMDNFDVDMTKDCDIDPDHVGEAAYDRIRLGYGKLGDLTAFSITTTADYEYTKEVPDPADPNLTTTTTQTVAAGTALVDGANGGTYTYTVYESSTDWDAESFGADDIAYIKDTGELIFGKNVAEAIKSGKADISATYEKTNFSEGEPRPEYYYDCRDITDSNNVIEYKKTTQAIEYEISSGIYLQANTEASDVLSTDIGRDVNEMIDVVKQAIIAHDTLDKIEEMKKSDLYADEDSQARLQTYLDAAEKQAAYADDNMQKTFSQGITNFNNYLQKVNLAATNNGCKEQRLSLTKTRVENQKDTVEELKNDNDNREISDIIIDYYAAYNAYTASLTAAAKVNQQTLLNYL